MSATVETTADMSSPSESPSTPAVEQATPRADAPAAAAAEPPHEDTPGLARRIAGKQLRSVSPNVVITLVGGLLTGLLLWQLNALGDSIDGLRSDMQSQIGGLRSEIGDLRTDMQGEIGDLRTDMQGQIGDLRAEMQAGFREVNATLLDHTERLARLETWAGLTASDE